MSILDEIIDYKREEVASAKRNAPLAALEMLARENSPPRGFEAALRRKGDGGVALIAEIKKASPSKGLIREKFAAGDLARAYAAGGAACLSVLTDGPSFQGSPQDLRLAKEATALPILRKDFMVDPYQAVEARAWGADCVLLIMACLSDAQALEIGAAARAHHLDILIETHDAAEIDRAARLPFGMIGINNRNLRTFVTDLSVFERLAPMAPRGRLLVAESGIASPADIARLARAGAGAYLIGETLMRQTDVEAATRNLVAPTRLA